MARERPDPLRLVLGGPERATTAPERPGARPRTLREEWDALADRTGAQPFTRPGWIDAWHRAYGKGELELLTVRDGSELLGVLPLDVAGGVTRSPTNTHTPFFGPVADGPGAERLLAWELLHQSPRRLDLAQLDPDSTWYAALQSAIRESRWHAIAQTTGRPPYVLTGGDWDAYRQTLSKNLVKQIARRRRRLEEAGEVSIAVHTATAGVEAAMQGFVVLEASGWKAQHGTAITSRAESVRFYEELAAWAAGRGALRIAFLHHAGVAIAAELALDSDGVVYSLKGGFDPEYRRYGPGQLLTFESLARAFADGRRSYELLGTDDDYKLAWTDLKRERVRLRAYPRGIPGAARYRARRHLAPIWSRLRSR